MSASKAMKISPENLLGDWGYVEDWSNGNTSAPGDWAMVGTAGSVARETSSIKFGLYSMKITAGATGTYAAELSLSNYGDYAGLTITFGMWVLCSSASKARIYIDDGVTPVYSSYHTGDGTWQFLTVTIQVSSSNTKLTFGAQMTNNGIVGYFDGGTAVQGELLYTALQDTNIYAREVDLQPAIKVGVSQFDLARREGVFVSNVKFQNRDIKMTVQLWDTSLAAARAWYDSIVKAFLEGKKDLYIADDRLMKVYCNAISRIRYNADFQMATIDASFLAPMPYEQYVGRLRTKQAISASPTAFSVPYLGSFKSRPVIQVVAGGSSITQCVLQNLTTGQTMAFTGTIAANKTLVIDCEAQTVLNDSVDAIANFTGSFLMLVPGTNYLVFTGSNGTIKVDYFNRWL